MKTEHKILVLALAMGFLTWVFDAYVDYFFFYDASFSDSLFTKVSAHETYMRLVVVFSLFIFGVIASGFAKQLRERDEQLKGALTEAHGRQAETAALLNASRALMEHRTFADAARAIFDHCREIIRAPGGYISLTDKTGTQNEVVFLEAGGLPCTVDPDTPMPIRGLRAEAYEEGRAIYDNSFSQSVYTTFLPEGHITVENVLFAPLVLQGKPVGLLGLANKPGGFTDHDAILASGFAELAAIALVHKRAEEERERLLKELEAERSFLETVVEQMPAGVTIVDSTSGKFILGNRELKNIWQFAELPANLKEGFFQNQIFHPEGQPYSFAEWPLVRSLEHGEVVVGEEADVIRKDGSRCTLRVSSAPIRDSQGNLIAGVAACIDITGRKLAEEALKESEERFRLAFENANTGMTLVGVDGRHLQVNNALCEMLGYSKEELENMTVHDTTHPEDIHVSRDFISRALAGEISSATFAKKHLHKQGQAVWVEVSSSLVRNSQGQPLYFISQVQDITERRQAEEALKESREMFLQMAENIRDVFFIRDASTGKLHYVSPAYEHIWGRTTASLYENPRSFLECVHPEDRDSVAAAYEKHSRGLTHHQEHRIVHQDGEIGWIWVRAFPIRNDKGEVYRVAGIAEDITERKRAEEDLKQAHAELERRVQERTLELSRTVEQLRFEIEEREKAEAKLRDSEARFRTLLQTAGSYTVTLTPDGRIIEFNQEAERVTGWKRHEVEGKEGFSLFLSDENRAVAEAEMRKLVAGEIIRSFELPIRLKDGSERVYLWNANIVCGYGSQPMEIIAVGQDITSRKLAEEALREQSRILEAFFEHTINPLVFLDREFNFIRVNKAYARACHRQVSDFPARNYFDLYPHEENQALFQSVLQIKAPYQALAQAFAISDHPEWGVTYWDWTLVPILDERSDVDFLVFTLNDVTQRMLAEEKKAQLIEIIEATPDFVGTADLKGRILYVNRAGRQMLGLAEDEDPSQLRIVNIHPPETGKLLLEEALPVARRQGVWQGETRFLARDGREIPISQVILVHQGAHGKEAFYSTIARDISDIKQAEQKLRMLTSQLLKAQENERRRLSRELHDELGQSLLVLKMQTRSIERKLPQGQDILREDCNRALKYIDEIIENVRRLSRDLTPVVLEDLGLSAALNYLFDEFRRHHATMNFMVELDPADELIPQEAQINIFRIFQESLTNIAKYAQATQARVSLKRQGDRLLGIVEDDGVGFDVAEVLAREGYGKGLGLAAMDERLRIIGGSLHISSERDKGTRVEFTVPLRKQEA